MIQVTIEASKLLVRFKYDVGLKERVKALPASYWSRPRRAWTFPATATCAANLIDAFGPGLVRGDEEFNRLIDLDHARRLAYRYRDGKIEAGEPEFHKGASWGHQRQGYRFVATLWGGAPNPSPQGAALPAFDMGAGKTRVAIQLIENFALRRILVLCPKSVIDVWPEQWAKHAVSRNLYSIIPLSSDEGSIAERAQIVEDVLATKPFPVVVLNYEAARVEPMASVLASASWNLIILDEAHRCKAPGSLISRYCSKLGRQIPLRLALTGTPLPHSPLDAYGLYRFLDPGIFGNSYAKFRDRYAITVGEQNIVVGYKNLDEMHDKMSRLMMRVTKEECLDLPELVHERLTCRLSKKAERIYLDLESDLYAQIDTGEVTAANALVKLLRLQQLTSGHIKDDNGVMSTVDSAKETLLHDLLTDLGNEPIVVFTRFRHDLDTVKSLAFRFGHDRNRGPLHGYAELSGRKNELKAWQDGKANIIGIQLQAGGVGIDLTRSRYAVYFSVGFSLADYLQSVARLHRPGQEHKVTCYHLVASGTVDEHVYDALSKRQEIVESVLDSMYQPQERRVAV
jgi:SNF2 family DNA or RNA helicase